MSLGSTFARTFSPDQPLYAIHADGIDGRRPVLDEIDKMAEAYVREIEEARPNGPIRVGGMCAGCLIALEMVPRLQQNSRQALTPILADPTPIAPGFEKRNPDADRPGPEVVRQLYDQARRLLLTRAVRPDHDVPFDVRDKGQLHAATLVALQVVRAVSRYVPSPYSGPVELIISEERAASFFHPQMPWQKLLTGPCVAHVLPWDHTRMLTEGREAVARLVKFILEDDLLRAFPKRGGGTGEGGIDDAHQEPQCAS
jgi:thioesterase domain-containing protein